jgi:hypothetical protein
MKRKKILIQSVIIILFQSALLYGQTSNSTGIISPWEIGVSTGVTTFLTSINSKAIAPSRRINYWYANLNPCVGLSVARNISPAFGMEFNWLNTRLTGRWNDNWPAHPLSFGQESPFTFNSSINQFDLMMTLNLNQIMLPGEIEDPWHFFIKTGIGLSCIKDNKKFYQVSNYQSMSIPLDVGISFSLSERVKLLMGSTWRLVKSDHVDGVQVVYTDVSGNISNELGTIYELYNFTYISITYGFGHFSSKKSNASPNLNE